MGINLATRVTLLRLFLVPLFVMAGAYRRYELATVLFVTAGLTDALDGFLARALRQRSRLGAVLDALADKALILGAFGVLSLVPGALRVPLWLTILVVSRDVLIVLTAVSLFASTGRRDFTASWLGKATTFVQIVYLSSVLLLNVLARDYQPLAVLEWVTAALTVASGLSYVAGLVRQQD
jgi:cardiolipin synthase